jgi:hypothetical protein
MAYTIGVEFEWDDTKNDACFERRKEVANYEHNARQD